MERVFVVRKKSIIPKKILKIFMNHKQFFLSLVTLKIYPAQPWMWQRVNLEKFAKRETEHSQ